MSIFWNIQKWGYGNTFSPKKNYFSKQILLIISHRYGTLKHFKVSLQLGEASYTFREELNIFQRLSVQNVRFLTFLIQGKSDFKTCITLRKAVPGFFLVFQLPYLREKTCFKQVGCSVVEGTSQVVLGSSDQRKVPTSLSLSGFFFFQICLVYGLAIQGIWTCI